MTNSNNKSKYCVPGIVVLFITVTCTSYYHLWDALALPSCRWENWGQREWFNQVISLIITVELWLEPRTSGCRICALTRRCLSPFRGYLWSGIIGHITSPEAEREECNYPYLSHTLLWFFCGCCNMASVTDGEVPTDIEDIRVFNIILQGPFQSLLQEAGDMLSDRGC